MTELRRKDLDLDAGVIRVRRAVTRTEGGFCRGHAQVGGRHPRRHDPPAPAAAGQGAPAQQHHRGRDGLLFPSSQDPHHHLAPASLYRVFYPAREAAGRPDARWHDLRHTGAVLAAQTGATLAELMARLGHSTAAAALMYQHAAKDRDKVIAEALSAMATKDL